MKSATKEIKGESREETSQDKLDLWLALELAKAQERMQESETELTKALTEHGLKKPVDTSVSNIQSLLRVDISGINAHTDLETLNQKLNELLAKQADKDPKALTFSKMITKLKKNTRELIKSNLTTNHNMPALDAKMNDYQDAQISYLTSFIAYKNAKKRIVDHEALQKHYQEQYPGCKVDEHDLIRHEECTNLHKTAGLNLDTGLTAVSMPILASQTKHDLSAYRKIHSGCVNALKAVGLIKAVTLHLSPVRRAYQTAQAAVFDADIPDSTLVAREYTETKHGKTAVVGARSSSTRGTEAGLPLLTETIEAFKNKTVNPDAFEENDSNKKIQNERVNKAVKTFIEEKPAQPGATMNVLVAHGGVNRDMLQALRIKCVEENIPCDIPDTRLKLSFGDYFTVRTVRDPNTEKIVAVSYGGQYTRTGLECSSKTAKQHTPDSSDSEENEFKDKAKQAPPAQQRPN